MDIAQASGKRTLVVFIHGFIDSGKLWDDFLRECRADTELSAAADFACFDYSQDTTGKPAWAARVDNLAAGRLPLAGKSKTPTSVKTIATSLQTELDANWPGYTEIVLVGHSMGGLVALRTVVSYLLEQERHGSPVRPGKLLLLAVPHRGSDIASVFKLLVAGNRQLEQLSINSDFLEHLEEDWNRLKIPERIHVRVLIASQDEVVPEQSARGYAGVRRPEVIKGARHNSICSVTQTERTAFNILRQLVQLPALAPAPPPGPAQPPQAPPAGAIHPPPQPPVDAGTHAVDRALELSGKLAVSEMKNQELQTKNEELERELQEAKEKSAALEAMIAAQAPQPASEETISQLTELKIEISTLERASELFRQGVAAYERADWQEALRRTDESAALDRNWSVLNNLGVLYHNLNRFREALAAYEEAVRLREQQDLSPDPDLAMNRGVVYTSLGRFEEALIAYEEAERLRAEQGLSPDPGLAANRSVVFHNLSRFDEALTALDEAERRRVELELPPDPGLITNRGTIYASLSRYEEALAVYDRALRLREEQSLPPDPVLAANRGVAYRKLSRLDEALAAFEEAKLLNAQQGLPQDSDLATNLGNVYFNLNRFEEAFAAFDEATRLREEQGLPPNPELAMNRGVIYASLSRFKEALAAFDEAARIREQQGLPPNPGLAVNRALVALNQGNTELACRFAKEARELYQDLVRQGGAEPPQVQQLIDVACGGDG